MIATSGNGELVRHGPARGSLRLLLHVGDSVIPVESARERLTLGRGSECDVFVPDPCVSRQHAELYQFMGRFFIRDLHSQNGTQLNYCSLDDCPELLQSGDLIQMGAIQIEFLQYR